MRLTEQFNNAPLAASFRRAGSSAEEFSGLTGKHQPYCSCEERATGKRFARLFFCCLDGLLSTLSGPSGFWKTAVQRRG